MTEFKPKEKFKHLATKGDLLLQCISCGDCREQTDYTADPPKWGVCVARENTSGFEPFFGRGKMQIIRSLWQGKLNLSKDMAEVIFQCPTCNACSDACAYEMDNASLYEALRAELVDAGCGLEAHIPMNKAILELLNPYQRDNKQKAEWLEKLDFEVKDASTDQAEYLYYVGCTASLTPEIQSVAINTAKVLHKLGIDFSVFGEQEVCCGSVSKRTGDLKVFNAIATKNYELFKKYNIKKIITSCAGCYRTLKADYADKLKDLGIEVIHSIELIRNIIKEKSIPLKHLGITVTYHDPCHTGRNAGTKENINPLYEEPRELLKKIATLVEMKTIKNSTKCCGAGGGVKKGFPELALEIAKKRIQEADETKAEYLVSICPFCFRNLSDAIKALNSKLKMVDLMELLDQALN